MRCLLLLVGLVGSVAALHRGLFYGGYKEPLGLGKKAQPTHGKYGRPYSLPDRHETKPHGLSGPHQGRWMIEPPARKTQPIAYGRHQDRRINDNFYKRKPQPIAMPPGSLGYMIKEYYKNDTWFYGSYFRPNGKGALVPTFFCEEGKCTNIFYDITNNVGEIIKPAQYDPEDSEPSPNNNSGRTESKQYPYPRADNFGEIVDPLLIGAGEVFDKPRYQGHSERKPKSHNDSKVDDLLRILQNSKGKSPADAY